MSMVVAGGGEEGRPMRITIAVSLVFVASPGGRMPERVGQRLRRWREMTRTTEA